MSFIWVVLYHVMFYTLINAFSDRSYDNAEFLVNDVFSHPWFVMFDISATFAVDSFFWLGGFLYAKKLQSLRKRLKKTYIWWPLSYVFRWLRIVPALMFVWILVWIIPTWLDTTVPAETISKYKDFVDDCGHDWWR